MSVCKENRLYDAIIYIHNAAMLDYTGPIEEMVDIIAAPLAMNKEPNYAEIEVSFTSKMYIHIHNEHIIAFSVIYFENFTLQYYRICFIYELLSKGGFI